MEPVGQSMDLIITAEDVAAFRKNSVVNHCWAKKKSQCATGQDMMKGPPGNYKHETASRMDHRERLGSTETVDEAVLASGLEKQKNIKRVEFSPDRPESEALATQVFSGGSCHIITEVKWRVKPL